MACLSASLLLFSCQKGKTIEEIGNHSMTTSDFNEYYNTRLERVTRLANIDKKSVAKYMCSAAHPFERQIAEELDPEQTYKKYRDLRMVEQVANLDGFMDRPVIKRIVEQAVLEQIAQLYLQEKMEKYIKITAEQKEDKCRELKQSDPGRYGPLPLDQCIAFAERLLVSEQFKKYQPILIEEIKERVQVKKNVNFDKDEYLRKDVEGYRSLRRSGGCPVDDSKTESKSEKTEPETKTP